MPAWLIALLAKVIVFLTEDLWIWLKGLWAKAVRSKKQADAAAIMKADQGKPRDEQVRKDEATDIDS